MVVYFEEFDKYECSRVITLLLLEYNSILLIIILQYAKVFKI